MDHIVASYLVKVTVRAKQPDVTTSIPIDALTECVEQAIEAEYILSGHDDVTVKATAERTDQ
jgi:hypothetical protein